MKIFIVLVFAFLLILGAVHESHAKELLPLKNRMLLRNIDPPRIVPGGPNQCTSCHPGSYDQKATSDSENLRRYVPVPPR